MSAPGFERWRRDDGEDRKAGGVKVRHLGGMLVRVIIRLMTTFVLKKKQFNLSGFYKAHLSTLLQTGRIDGREASAPHAHVPILLLLTLSAMNSMDLVNNNKAWKHLLQA